MKKMAYSIVSVLMLMLVNLYTFAQEGGKTLDVNVDIDKGGEGMANWMTNPLIWIIGALILIILIAVVARGGGNKSS